MVLAERAPSDIIGCISVGIHLRPGCRIGNFPSSPTNGSAVRPVSRTALLCSCSSLPHMSDHNILPFDGSQRSILPPWIITGPINTQISPTIACSPHYPSRYKLRLMEIAIISSLMIHLRMRRTASDCVPSYRIGIWSLQNLYTRKIIIGSLLMMVRGRVRYS